MTDTTNWNEYYEGVPKFPKHPPTDEELPEGAVRHACMGLNSCKGQDRFGKKGHPDGQGGFVQNQCAGQGYCSTALNNLGQAQDHSCHVQNGCCDQGGCGLYGTRAEQENPGHNSCKNLGSCATPINAERFSTEGLNKGKSVWDRARAVFEDKWPARRAALKAKHPDWELPEKLDDKTPGNAAHPDMFAHGPRFTWITSYSGESVAACGASGMSGAGSCA